MQPPAQRSFPGEEGADCAAASGFGRVPSPDPPALAGRARAGCPTPQSWLPPLCSGVIMVPARALGARISEAINAPQGLAHHECRVLGWLSSQV